MYQQSPCLDVQIQLEKNVITLVPEATLMGSDDDGGIGHYFNDVVNATLGLSDMHRISSSMKSGAAARTAQTYRDVSTEYNDMVECITASLNEAVILCQKKLLECSKYSYLWTLDRDSSVKSFLINATPIDPSAKHEADHAPTMVDFENEISHLKRVRHR